MTERAKKKILSYIQFEINRVFDGWRTKSAPFFYRLRIRIINRTPFTFHQQFCIRHLMGHSQIKSHKNRPFFSLLLSFITQKVLSFSLSKSKIMSQIFEPAFQKVITKVFLQR